jgi:ribosomal protein L11 methyltransferase
MTHTAVLSLGEADARRLADAIAEDPALEGASIDVTEAAPGRWEVVVYFEERPSKPVRAALAHVASTVLGLGAHTFRIEALPETDWVAKSLAGLKPVRAGRFLVHGSHDRDKRRPNDIAIDIEAGQAFGTGHHGTTAGCLRAIDALAKARRFGKPLDLGTGSGVLAIALAKALKAKVLASDIDPVAVEVARENARLNGVGTRVNAIVAAGLGGRAFRIRAPFDLVVANILARPLILLAPAIRRNLALSGVVVLSGILPEQRARVVSAYRHQGLKLTKTVPLEGWVTLIFERNRTGGARGPARLERAPRNRQNG